MTSSERPSTRRPADPLWYKDAILYELHVRAYKDAVGDGTGDFTGLAEKLDYLQDLGITAIWLLPFYPSPLKDDGYDTADYTDVHPAYGTMRDFRAFLKEAHRRGLRVITELVLNHTSDQHPWFQRARRAKPGSAARNFYVWSDTPDKYQGTRIIFQDFEHSNWTWDHEARAYYWHRFYSHQPDLNWDNPQVRKTMLQVLDFWFDDVGVDGLRLDAVPYLFEREGTNNENLPETHAALKEIRRFVDERYPDKMLLAEANQWPEDAVAYFGSGTGDECHTAFHFPLMPRMFMGIRTEDRYPIVDMLEQTPPIPANCQWVLFLRNHDELTLEMVTDEERDYMYRVYAQDQQARINVGIRRRLAPLLGNSRRKIELMNGLLLSLPGTPVLYYGDEIGMGDNFYLGDRNGVRTPMQWSPDRNAGFSRANSQKLYSPVIIDPEYHYETINVEVQQDNPESLLWWTKRILSVRKQFKAFGRGTLEFLHPENNKVLAFVRAFESETVLVVANLSRFAQHVDLNLGAFKGLTPVELFGRNPFPVVSDAPYPLALGPHSFYWFSLEPLASGAAEPASALPLVVWGGTARRSPAGREPRHAGRRAARDPSHAALVPRPAAQGAVGRGRGAGPGPGRGLPRLRPRGIHRGRGRDLRHAPGAGGREAGGRPEGAVAARLDGARAGGGRGGERRALRPALGARLLRGAARVHGAQAAARARRASSPGGRRARSAARAIPSRAHRPASPSWTSRTRPSSSGRASSSACCASSSPGSTPISR